jgi:hypothetical protein
MSSFWNLFGPKQENEGDPNAPQGPNLAPGQMVPLIEPPLAAPVVQPPIPEQHKPMGHKPRYGIDDAIKLMRTLPVEDNVDLVVRVIKRTLESLNVRVGEIIEDAGSRQDFLRTKVTEAQAAIAEYEREIETRRQEIRRLEEELAETTVVRERLQLAEALPNSTPPKVGFGGGRKIDVSSPPIAPSKPPVPLSFRPKIGSEPLKKPTPVEAPTPAAGVALAKLDKLDKGDKDKSDKPDWPAEDDGDSEPVQSTDLIDKNP